MREERRPLAYGGGRRVCADEKVQSDEALLFALIGIHMRRPTAQKIINFTGASVGRASSNGKVFTVSSNYRSIG